MFWDLPSDDFNNRCGRGSYPIIRAVSTIVKGNTVCKEITERNGQLTTPSPTTPSPTTPSPTTPSPSGTEKTETASPGCNCSCNSGGLKETATNKMIVFAVFVAYFSLKPRVAGAI